jgi:MFS family permease
MFIGSTMLTPLYALYADEFGFSPLMLTIIYAAYAMGNLGALLFLGRLSDQVGRRIVVLPAVAAAGIATLIFLFAESTPWLAAARIASGLAIGVAAAAATAWVTELVPKRDHSGAGMLATTATFVGMGAGPLLAGLLAAGAPAPLRTTYVAYLALLAFAAWRVASLVETVEEPERRWRRLSLRPRLGVPRGMRKAFVAPAIGAFATFALTGFYCALLPSMLADDLGLPGPMPAGIVVAGMFFIAALTDRLTSTWSSRTAMLAGLPLLVCAAGGLVLAQSLAGIASLLLPTIAGGVGAGLAYRGTLQMVNKMAPDDKQAEILASYLIACYLGNSLPVVGVGLLAAATEAHFANDVFAAVLAVIALTALTVGWHFAPRR